MKKWKPPDHHFLKINCDVAFKESSMEAAFSFLIRDSSGWLLDGCSQIILASSSLHAECLAMEAAVLFAKENELHNIVLFLNLILKSLWTISPLIALLTGRVVSSSTISVLLDILLGTTLSSGSHVTLMQWPIGLPQLPSRGLVLQHGFSDLLPLLRSSYPGCAQRYLRWWWIICFCLVSTLVLFLLLFTFC